jgi:2-methylisocitrate lyase-like PEP mutase family enzyme
MKMSQPQGCARFALPYSGGMTTTDLAATFRALHQGPDVLVLANAWDAGSARLIESLGARAAATTSAGFAWALGYPDGNAVPVDVLAAAIATIARVIGIPLTADIEGGYSDDPQAVGETVARVIGAGAVGINIEDGSGSPDLLAAKIGAAKRAAAREGVDLFVNARTDVYLRGLVPAKQRAQEAIERGRRYREAGADGLFVPVLAKPPEIRKIVKNSALPLNVMAVPGLPKKAELAALGVRRLSGGAAIAMSVMGHAAKLATAFLAKGDSDRVGKDAMPYPQINGLFK